jgi:hypothetical protein
MRKSFLLRKIICSLKFHFALWMININGNLRQIINLKNLDACLVVNNVDKFPMFKNDVVWLNTTFTGTLKCPIKVMPCHLFLLFFNAILMQNFIVRNATIPLSPSDPLIQWQIMPNSRYKATMKATDELDDNIATVTYWQEDFLHMGDTKF